MAAGRTYHIQYAAEEVFTVLEGEVKFKVDDELIDAHPGDTLFVPRGVPHTFTNIHRDQPARSIGIYTPAGLEAFLRMWHEVSANGTPDESTRAELVSRYGWSQSGRRSPLNWGFPAHRAKPPAAGWDRTGSKANTAVSHPGVLPFDQ